MGRVRAWDVEAWTRGRADVRWWHLRGVGARERGQTVRAESRAGSMDGWRGGAAYAADAEYDVDSDGVHHAKEFDPEDEPVDEEREQEREGDLERAQRACAGAHTVQALSLDRVTVRAEALPRKIERVWRQMQK